VIAGEVIVEISNEIGNENRIARDKVEAGEVQMVMIEGSGKSSAWLEDNMVKDIVREINCPVWIIPENTEYRPFHHIIYATDYHEEDLPTIKRLIEFTHNLNPRITALHITDNVDFELKIKNVGFKKMLETKAGNNRVEVKALVDQEGNQMAELLHLYASREGADLMVVLKENRLFLERLFKPSSSERIIEESGLPVLVFHTN
jgi:nucleotide-binding universal stress UspA family protein